jgi:hypothetical protein
MIPSKWASRSVPIVLTVCLVANVRAQQAQSANRGSKAPTRSAQLSAPLDYQPGVESKAIDILKSASARLAAAKSMSFTAFVSYESPSRLGPPLIYSTKSEIVMQRPDRLRVITLGDGPRSEFYYDGKTLTAFDPAQNLVAVSDAPPTLDAALQKAYDIGAVYFPFTDMIVADPYKDIADGLKVAFYIGQSSVVGDTTTDMVAYVSGEVFVQVWIGTQDKLPRRIYAVYLNDPARLRHVLALSDWVLDPPVPADAFTPAEIAGAAHIAFERPDATDSHGDAAAAKDQDHPSSMKKLIMKTVASHVAGFLSLAFASGFTFAWEHAGGWSHENAGGGMTSHAAGSDSTTRTNAWGGSETHTYGQGTTATNRYGDTATHTQGSGQTTVNNQYGASATHTYGQGTTATNAYGGTATHTAGSGQTTYTNSSGANATHTYGQGTTATNAYGATATHTTGSGYTTYTSASGTTAYHSTYTGATYTAYHPPTAVNVYASGCYNCGGWSTAGAAAAGAAVGAAAGAAVASANTQAVGPAVPSQRFRAAPTTCVATRGSSLRTARTVSTIAWYLHPDGCVMQTRARQQAKLRNNGACKIVTAWGHVIRCTSRDATED